MVAVLVLREDRTREFEMQNASLSAVEFSTPNTLAAARRKVMFSAALMLTTMVGGGAALVVLAFGLS